MAGERQGRGWSTVCLILFSDLSGAYFGGEVKIPNSRMTKICLETLVTCL